MNGVESGKPTVLIIEDEAAARKLYQVTLTRLGPQFKYVIVPTGIEGLAYFEANRDTHLIVTDRDLNSPEDLQAGITGEIVAERIRQITGRQDDPHIILVSGRITQQDHKLLMEKGINEFLPKPFRPISLVEALTRANQRFQMSG